MAIHRHAGGPADPHASLSASSPGAEAGVNIHSILPSVMKQVKKLGVHWVRIFVTWAKLEPKQGEISSAWMHNWTTLIDARPPGVKVIVDFVEAPSWATGSSAPNAPPSNPAEYAKAIGYLATRWAGKVAAFEVWNEEDSSGWWGGEVGAYTEMLKAAYAAVKAADPETMVVLGGLVGNDYEFLQKVYAAGGKGSFDAIGVHLDTSCDYHSPYFVNRHDGRIEKDIFTGYKEVHATELRNGSEVPIWMTELSWRSTGNKKCGEGYWKGKTPEGVSEKTQAEYLKQAYNCLAQVPYVKLGLWFSLSDEPGAQSGLLHENGTKKPAWTAMREYVQHGNQLHEACKERERKR